MSESATSLLPGRTLIRMLVGSGNQTVSSDVPSSLEEAWQLVAGAREGYEQLDPQNETGPPRFLGVPSQIGRSSFKLVWVIIEETHASVVSSAHAASGNA